MYKRLIEFARFHAAQKNWDPKEVVVFCESYSGMKAIKNDDGETRDGIRISGMLSTFKNVDREGDVVMDSAFDNTVKDFKKSGSKMPLLFDHRNETGSQAGSIDKLKVTKEGLFFEAFISETEKTRHQIKLIQDGHLNTVSMGGIFKFKEMGRRDSRNRSFIEEVKLFEGSIVPIPANNSAIFQLSDSEDPGKSVVIDDSQNPLRVSVTEKTRQILAVLEKK